MYALFKMKTRWLLLRFNSFLIAEILWKISVLSRVSLVIMGTNSWSLSFLFSFYIYVTEDVAHWRISFEKKPQLSRQVRSNNTSAVSFWLNKCYYIFSTFRYEQIQLTNYFFCQIKLLFVHLDLRIPARRALRSLSSCLAGGQTGGRRWVRHLEYTTLITTPFFFLADSNYNFLLII